MFTLPSRRLASPSLDVGSATDGPFRRTHTNRSRGARGGLARPRGGPGV